MPRRDWRAHTGGDLEGRAFWNELPADAGYSRVHHQASSHFNDLLGLNSDIEQSSDGQKVMMLVKTLIATRIKGRSMLGSF